MNKDINKTLSALVPILRMNGEKVKSIEAVQNWYHVDGQEYMKEVAEITYDSGARRYADIGSDSNLTALYDALAVIQEIKYRSKYIERIVRDVYEKDGEENHAVEALKCNHIACVDCKHGRFGDVQCNNCSVRYQSHYERRTDDSRK